VLILLALCFGRTNKGIAGATLILLLIGAGGCVLAAMTGDAAQNSAAPRGDGERVLAEHEVLGELARNLFLILAGAYLLILLAAAALKDRLKRSGWVALHALFLLGYTLGMLALINTSHLGGRLVHQYGVRAAITGPMLEPIPDDD